MKTKTILSIAIIAVLPLTANAENISGNMYTAPAHETQQTPAPTTNAEAPFGRVNIDTNDQNHIATTAYVKGAYNSAIAAVNGLQQEVAHDLGDKQDKMIISSFTLASGEPVDSSVIGIGPSLEDMFGIDDIGYLMSSIDYENPEYINTLVGNDNSLITAGAVALGIDYKINQKRVKIYTTWGNDTDAATAEVPFVTASSN